MDQGYDVIYAVDGVYWCACVCVLLVCVPSCQRMQRVVLNICTNFFSDQTSDKRDMQRAAGVRVDVSPLPDWIRTQVEVSNV